MPARWRSSTPKTRCTFPRARGALLSGREAIREGFEQRFGEISRAGDKLSISFEALQRSTDGVNFSALATLAANTQNYSDTSVAGDTTYYYRVRAGNTAGLSAWAKTGAVTGSCRTLVAVCSDPARPWIVVTPG